jgi:predicted acyl esterase
MMLVRGAPMRARFRRGFATPVPLVADRPDSVRFTLSDVHHRFRAGHRLVVQVQASWFPMVDRNPQTFVPDIFEAPREAYRAATMRVFHDARRPSRLEVRVMP